MTGTRSIRAPHADATIPVRRRPRAGRIVRALFAAGGCAVTLAVLPGVGSAASQSRLARAAVTAHSAVSVFCAHLPASKVSADVGATVSLTQAVVEKSTLECIYFGKAAASAAHPIDEVVISMEPGLNASEAATRAAAEARVAAESPKTVTLIFTPLPAVGPTAFSWNYSKPLNGGQLSGIANNKGTTGYGAVVGGAAATFGSGAKYLTDLEHLLALAIAA